MEIKHLFTKQGEAFTGKEYDEYYPRPMLKRDSFFSLNGKWHLKYGDGQEIFINVPFAPESILSGVFKSFNKDVHLTYTKKFTLPKGFLKDRVIINFGAVDQICVVYLNGHKVGKNVGGYNSFSFDITDFLESENTLVVEVWDNLSNKALPYGKQDYKRGGMWYTPVSGIWQSVWLESVPKKYVKSIKVVTSLSGAKIYFTGIDTGTLKLTTPSGADTYEIDHGICDIKLNNPSLWSPDSPYLYYYTVKAGEDTVSSYFALRELSIKEINGSPRICLNGEPIFFHGVLDQGYFSDGIFTPASPTMYDEDIKAMKSLGFNTLRKHIKVEPEQFYYACDKLGMIVFQDMVNNGSYSFLRDTALPTVITKKIPLAPMIRSKQEKAYFYDGMKKTVKQLFNHPCICYWTIFNEGWGQFESEKAYDVLYSLDNTRIIDTTSGWFRGHKSQVESLHIYFKKVKIKKRNKPVILSEFGGYSYKVENHCANTKKTYGYKLFDNAEEFEKQLVSLYEEQIIPSIEKGLCGAIYTQLSDVEDETNGLLTYDRKKVKVNAEAMLKIAEKLKIN